MNSQNPDPVTRFVDKNEGDIESMDEGLSPMAPPDGFNPPASVKPVPRDELAPFLQQLFDEHVDFVKQLDTFEKAITSLQTEGITREADKAIRDFFEYFDNHFIDHHRLEERILFPVLGEKLKDKGEHGKDGRTSVNLMEDDHIESVQQAAVIFNIMSLAMRLPDENSRLIALDVAIQQAKTLVENLRLHIFREDSIIFPLAHELINRDVLFMMNAE